MAKINWNRHSYTTKLDRDYYTAPSKGFDKAWHKANKANKEKLQKANKAKQEAKLQMQREKIKALRTNKT